MRPDDEFDQVDNVEEDKVHMPASVTGGRANDLAQSTTMMMMMKLMTTTAQLLVGR
jgi:hypothetical protein